MAVTTQILRDHLETDVSNSMLTRLLSDANEFLNDLAGPETGTVTKEYLGGGFLIRLQRPAEKINSVTEITSEGTETLTTDDYLLQHNGRLLRRTGNKYWEQTVKVEYQVQPDTAKRDMVVIDLVHLALTYRGAIKVESDGEYSQQRVATPEAYEHERYVLASRLLPNIGVLV